MQWDELKVNDLVRLRYTGYHRVPLWLSGSWATVIKRNRHGNLVVQAKNEQEGYTRTIQKMDISGIEKLRKS